jgi:hypothetical protein
MNPTTKSPVPEEKKTVKEKKLSSSHSSNSKNALADSPSDILKTDKRRMSLTELG